MTAQLDMLSRSLTPTLHDASDWQTLLEQHVTALPAGQRVQLYDLIEAGLPEPSDVAHGSGAALSTLARRRPDLLACVGAEPSKRPTVRGSLTRVWERL